MNTKEKSYVTDFEKENWLGNNKSCPTTFLSDSQFVGFLFSCNMKKASLRFIILFAVCFSGREVKAAKPNLVDLALSLNLTTFVDSIRKAGVDKIINHEGKFTVFAPTNEAFEHEKCYPGEISRADILRFHVAWGTLKSKDVIQRQDDENVAVQAEASSQCAPRYAGISYSI